MGGFGIGAGLNPRQGAHDYVPVTYIDEIQWDDKLLQQRQQWAKSFAAIKNSPDKATVDKYVAELVAKPDRRLACETSPFVDFLSVLAILLPLMFLIYWMFLRRIYYPKRNKSVIQKTVKGSRFRAAL